MNKISNLNIKILSLIIFIGLIVATHNLIIPKNILLFIFKIIILIPSVALIVKFSK